VNLPLRVAVRTCEQAAQTSCKKAQKLGKVEPSSFLSAQELPFGFIRCF
jgi:hypothetical protein